MTTIKIVMWLPALSALSRPCASPRASKTAGPLLPVAAAAASPYPRPRVLCWPGTWGSSFQSSSSLLIWTAETLRAEGHKIRGD